MASLARAIPFVATLGVACSASSSGFTGIGNEDETGPAPTTSTTTATEPDVDADEDTTATTTTDADATTDADTTTDADATTDVDATTDATTDADTPPPKWVFVTSSTISGAMGGLAGADAICQDLADDAGLAGTYLAWLSDGVESPSTRFTRSTTTYALVDGTPIAENWDDLVDGSLAHAIDLTQTGGVPPAGNHTCGVDSVWSNVTAAGESADAASHCEGWTAADGIQSHSGRWDLATDEWSASCFGGGATCLWFSPIYCFAQ